MKPLQYETSCGAVIFHQTADQRRFLLVQSSRGGHVGFPKGHQVPGETAEQTACREILEETGLQPILDTGFCYELFYRPQPFIIKKAVYFLAETPTVECRCCDEEVARFIWATREEARALLREEYQTILEEAEAYLDR
ncbi:MAG: NUDIX domain-containing protein [Clostridia bacterium]|nr:NUDIX domain-containing protein [Clostridia bacterium]